MIYVLAGDIRTGKTSALKEWTSTWDKVVGVLCPDGEDELRYLYDIDSEQRFPLEVAKSSDKTIRVGRFHFLQDSFKLANYLLIKAYDEQDFDFIVLDELGKLELQGEGIHLAAKYILDQYVSNDKINVLLVIRTNLVKEILAHYGITNFQIVAKENLP